MNHIYLTGVISLVIQVITAIVDFYALRIPIPPTFYLINDLVIIELIVQIIEGIFYLWMVSNFKTIKNITPFRYYDWALTTPTMLITLMFYLMFLRDNQKGIQSESFMTELKENWKVVLKVSILDWLMLIAGYLGEKEIFSYIFTTIIGFIPFIMMFYLIYVHFAVYSNKGRKIFWYFVLIWGIYGIAALLPYKIKNTLYNILDLFSKNFFGLFLAYVIYKARIISP